MLHLGWFGREAKKIVFSLAAFAKRNADVIITDKPANGPRMVPLTGVGIGGKLGRK